MESTQKVPEWNIRAWCHSTHNMVELIFFKIGFCEIRIQNIADTTQPTTPIESPGPQLFKNMYVCLPIPNTHGDRALQSKWILSDHRSPKKPNEIRGTAL